MKRIEIVFVIALLSLIIENKLDAQTSGPAAPEFTTFESVDATDLVNLFTGDFVYNIPVINIPSPNGGYPLALSYHAGIKNNQEATWVGLGWNINAGAINRSVNVYPDDYKNEQMYSYAFNSGESGVSIGLGIHSGPISLEVGYDFEKGLQGAVGLDFQYGIGPLEASVGIKSNSGISYGIEANMGIMQMSINDNGIRNSIGGLTVSQNYEQTSFSLASSCGQVGSYYNNEDWTSYNNSMSIPIWKGIYLKMLEWGYYLDKHKSEYAYGLLYYKDGYSGSDVKINTSLEYYQPGGIDPHTNLSMIELPADNYQVLGQGMTGTMKPYRTDNGSVSMTYGDSYCHFFANKAYIYRPEFRFIGERSNNFNYHIPGSGEDYHLSYALSGDYYTSAYDANVYTDPPNNSNEGQNNGRLMSARYVEWFSNSELNGNNILVEDPLYNQRNDLPADGIGAFQITDVDGTVYTYAIPVYNTYQFSMQNEKAEPTNVSYTLQNEPYAYTWLLTSIHGPDYMDINYSNQYDDEDWGYWVKFDYGKWTDYYHWKTPYSGKNQVNFNTDIETMSMGNKQIYYLNKIITRTHTALFIKDLRYDGKGASAYLDQSSECSGTQVWLCTDDKYISGSYVELKFDNGCYNTVKTHIPASLLKLDKIMLFKNEDLSKYNLDNIESLGSRMEDLCPDCVSLIDPITCGSTISGTDPMFNSSYLHQYDQIIDINDIVASGMMSNGLYERVLKEVEFEYDYSLCKNVVNNFVTRNFSYNTLMPGIYQYDYNWDKPQNPNNTGKLTLNSLKIKGKGGKKTIPDYEFDYVDFNPDFNSDSWDSWGMRSAFGGDHYFSHSVVQNSNYADDAIAWNLERITMPTGAVIEVDYERDEYRWKGCMKGAGINKTYTVETPIKYEGTFSQNYNFGVAFDHGNGTKYIGGGYYNDPQGLINLGYIHIYDNDLYNKLKATFHYGEIPVEMGYCSAFACTERFDPSGNVADITTGTGAYGTWEINAKIDSYDDYNQIIYFDPSYNYPQDWDFLEEGSPAYQRIFSLKINNYSKMNYTSKKFGGDIRVKSIKTITDDNIYKIGYYYTQDGSSSGVAFSEPVTEITYTGIKNQSRPLNFPSPFVGYSEVTVVNYGDDNSTEDKTTYNFHTINNFAGNIYQNQKVHSLHAVHGLNWCNDDMIIDSRGFYTLNQSSIIGTPKAILNYNNKDHLIDQTRYYYDYYYPRTAPRNGKPNLVINKGVISQGVILEERSIPPYQDDFYTRILRTTSVEYVPICSHVIKKVDGEYYAEQIVDLDNYTGEVSKQQSIHPEGTMYMNEIIPAYAKYPEMHSKYINSSNKNMLTQSTGSYYKMWDPTQSQWEVLAADIQTWNKDWMYRDYNQSKGHFDYKSYPYHGVWRKHKQYVWKGDIASDGSYAWVYDSGTEKYDKEYNFSETEAYNENLGWLKTNEITAYNWFSTPMESQDLNENYSSVKMGYDERYTIAAISNSNYCSFAYSGFEHLDLEDLVDGIVHYDGEIVDYQGEAYRYISDNVNVPNEYTSIHSSISGIEAHTGYFYLKIDGGASGSGIGPKYRASLNSNEASLERGRLLPGKYRASVWVYDDADEVDDTEAYLLVEYQNQGSTYDYVAMSEAIEFKENDWKLLNLDFEVTSTQAWANDYLNIYVSNTNPETMISSTNNHIYIDDLRIQPLHSTMTSYVYDIDGNISAILGTNNIATYYEYDDRGRLRNIKRETKKHGTQIVKEFNYHYGRQDWPDNPLTPLP